MNIDTTSYKDAGGILNPQVTAQIDINFQGLELNDQGGRVVTDFGYFNGDTNEYTTFVPDVDYTVARDDVEKKFTITFLPSETVTDAFKENRAIALLYSTKPAEPDYEAMYPAEITFGNLDYSTNAQLDNNAGGEPTPVGTMTAVLTKLDTDTQAPLAGAVFDFVRIIDDTHAERVATGLTTGADGNLTYLDPALSQQGTYEFRETQAPEDYDRDISINNPDHQFDVVDTTVDQTFDVLFQSSRTPVVPSTNDNGVLKWIKTDNCVRYALGGSKWLLTFEDGTSMVVVDNGENDADPHTGYLKVINLKAGRYTLKETKAPQHYKLSSMTYTAFVPANGTKDLCYIKNCWDYHWVDPNEPVKPTVVKWQAVDWPTGCYQRYTHLGGSEWVVTTKDGQKIVVIDNGTNDADGRKGFLQVNGLVPAGEFSIHETKAPEGYERRTDTWTRTVGSGRTFDFGRIRHKKTPSKTNCFGVSYFAWGYSHHSGWWY